MAFAGTVLAGRLPGICSSCAARQKHSLSQRPRGKSLPARAGNPDSRRWQYPPAGNQGYLIVIFFYWALTAPGPAVFEAGF